MQLVIDLSPDGTKDMIFIFRYMQYKGIIWPDMWMQTLNNLCREQMEREGMSTSVDEEIG